MKKKWCTFFILGSFHDRTVVSLTLPNRKAFETSLTASIPETNSKPDSLALQYRKPVG